jgi:asparagine synthase (glutamine-hydrolysing)
MLAESRIADAGVFEPKAVAQLWKKCRARAAEGQFSNADNMALVGVLSTQLLHERYVRSRPSCDRTISLTTDIERLHTEKAEA